jgi:alpha-glucosidase
MEYNAWSDGNPPEHTTIIPFTRMLSGPIDYTPGIFDLTFDEYKDKERVQTTLAKQLAYYVIIYSPMQMAADLPENYLNNPAFEFIRKVPVNWSKSRYLNSKIGDFVTIARKNGDNWYLGSITDEFARSISVSLSFLDEDKIYKATIYKDGSKADWKNNPYDFEISEDFVDSTMRLRLKLAKGGGQAIIFEPYKDR